MQIEFFGQLADNREKIKKINVKGIKKLLDLEKEIGINPDIIGLITVDGRQSDWNDQVTNDDHLCFFPYMSGG